MRTVFTRCCWNASNVCSESNNVGKSTSGIGSRKRKGVGAQHHCREDSILRHVVPRTRTVVQALTPSGAYPSRTLGRVS
ncbi:hypothetical protein V3C99_014840 [Haemonchus contortus]